MWWMQTDGTDSWYRMMCLCDVLLCVRHAIRLVWHVLYPAGVGRGQRLGEHGRVGTEAARARAQVHEEERAGFEQRQRLEAPRSAEYLLLSTDRRDLLLTTCVSVDRMIPAWKDWQECLSYIVTRAGRIVYARSFMLKTCLVLFTSYFTLVSRIYIVFCYSALRGIIHQIISVKSWFALLYWYWLFTIWTLSLLLYIL